MLVPNKRTTARIGFTLMEVLVVVAIIVVMAGAGGAIFMRYLEEAKESRASVDLVTLSQRVDTYKLKYGDYPPSLAVLTQVNADGSAAYAEVHELIDPWGQEYQYAYPGTHHQATGKPDIFSNGPKGAPKIIGNWNASGQ